MRRQPSPGDLRDAVTWERAQRRKDGTGGLTEKWTKVETDWQCQVKPLRARQTGDYDQESGHRPATHRITQRPLRGLVPGSARAIVTESNGRTYTADLVEARDLDEYRQWQELDVRETGPGSSPS